VAGLYQPIIGLLVREETVRQYATLQLGIIKILYWLTFKSIELQCQRAIHKPMIIAFCQEK
jgi:hypothetical protein